MSERLPPPSNEFFFEKHPWNHQWILCALALMVSGFDYMAGPVVLFPILFVIPVALMAWNCGLRTALILGAILCTIRLCIQFWAWGIPAPVHVALINAVLRLSVLLFITFLVGKLGEQTKALRARVRTLEGILPTCAFCKDIRDVHGNWHQIEVYVTEHTHARFSHGVCPECANVHYGDILKDIQQTNTKDPVA